MHTFVLNGRVIVSPNMSVPPPAVCLPPLKSDDEDEALSSGHKFRVMSPDYPQLPFSLRRTPRHGPLFSCLAYGKRSLPIVRINTLYQLRPDILDKWIALDDFLTDVFHVLGVMAPMNVVLTLVPRVTNYRKPRETEKAARGATSHALHLFQHLITLTSWAISGYPEGVDRPDPRWVKVLLDKGFPPAMVEMLRDSPVGAFSPTAPRVGTAVNPFNEQCVVRVQRMVQAHLPIYIIWGHCDRQGRRSFKNLPAGYLLGKWVRENCYPSDEDIVQAIALADAAEQTGSVRGPVPQRPLPVPPRGSRQKKGENWRDFLARREISNKEKEVHETPNETAAREQRARNALVGRVPGKKGATVFQWELVDDFRLRINIGHSTASEIWASYPGGQKRYDSFTDEWDICTEFDPTAPPEDDILEIDFDDDDGGQDAHTQSHNSPEPNPSAHQTARFVGGDVPQSESSVFPVLDDILQQRYGFTCSHSTRLAPPSNTITELAIKVCEGRAPSAMTSSLRNTAAAFLELLISGEPLNPDVCDMLDGSLEEEYKSGHVTVERRQGTRIALDGDRTSCIFYLIRFRQPMSCRFVISLDDPVAVLQIIRAQFGPDLPEVALQLASRGIPFGTRTLSEAVPTPISSCAEPPIGLGFVPSNYRPLPSDYISYLDKRDRLLRRSYGRAALMKGGIIARLARDSLGGRMDVLIQGGPSEHVLNYGSAIKTGQDYLWDDDLDSNDEQVICGVYKISTGKSTSSTPTSHQPFFRPTRSFSYFSR